MTTYLTSYATRRFEASRRELEKSAASYGISHHLSYQQHDLHASAYYRQNKELLDSVCGAGYWAWKPYFILQALNGLREEDVLFYCDAGTRFVSSPQALIELCRASATGLVLFDARPLQNRQFTKRDCFVLMGGDNPACWDANEVIATILVVRRCLYAIDFLKEWLGYCQDRAVITDDANICGKENLPGYLQHRWDQAILSVLAAKHELETFRNPTVWGNFLKLPAYRVEGEYVASPYDLLPEIRRYAATPQGNSPYGTIFAINRQPNMEGKRSLPQSSEVNVPAVPRTGALSRISQRLRRKLQTGLLGK